MKILMLGDYSNLHACLAAELRRRGHEVTVVSDGGGHMRTSADISLVRHPGLLGSLGYLYRVMALLPRLQGYDVVQLINPCFLALRPGKLRMAFEILRKNNRSVFLTLCGDDYYFVKDCVDSDLFRFSEFRVGKEKTPAIAENVMAEEGWLVRGHRSYHSVLYKAIDGAMSVLPEYDMSARRHLDPSKLIFTNIPIDYQSIVRLPEVEYSYPVKILVGIRSASERKKGTDRLLEICRELEREMKGKCEVLEARDLPLPEYLGKMGESHIVIDQLYSYSPATNALQTMAMGRIAASGAQPEYYEYVKTDLRPILELSPLESDEAIKKKLRMLILDPERMKRMSEEGRQLVRENNDVRRVASLFERHWNNILSKKERGNK